MDTPNPYPNSSMPFICCVLGKQNHTHPRTQTHVENRETRIEQRKAVGETPQELQSSPTRLSVWERGHSGSAVVLLEAEVYQAVPSQTLLNPRRSSRSILPRPCKAKQKLSVLRAATQPHTHTHTHTHTNLQVGTFLQQVYVGAHMRIARCVRHGGRAGGGGYSLHCVRPFVRCAACNTRPLHLRYLLDQPQGLERQQIRIPRTCPHEVDLPDGFQSGLPLLQPAHEIGPQTAPPSPIPAPNNAMRVVLSVCGRKNWYLLLMTDSHEGCVTSFRI